MRDVNERSGARGEERNGSNGSLKFILPPNRVTTLQFHHQGLYLSATRGEKRRDCVTDSTEIRIIELGYLWKARMRAKCATLSRESRDIARNYRG